MPRSLRLVLIGVLALATTPLGAQNPGPAQASPAVRSPEVTADRMCQHDSMEFAPAIVALIRRPVKSRAERRTCHQRERIREAAQQDDIATILSVGDAWYGKEIDAGRSPALTRGEILQQILESGEIGRAHV